MANRNTKSAFSCRSIFEIIAMVLSARHFRFVKTTTTMKNYKEYIDYCQNLALDISEDYTLDEIEVTDRIDEIADGCQYVIYYTKAWDLVNMMREYNHELFMHAVEEVQDNGFEHELAGDVNKLMTWIAFFLIRNGIHSAYQHIETEAVA